MKRQNFLPIWCSCLMDLRLPSIGFVGAILLGLTAVEKVEGIQIASSQLTTLIDIPLAQEQTRQKELQRHDPFKPIKKRAPIPKPKKTLPPAQTSTPRIEDPFWKLLGVIHGQDGHQAVIQVSPNQRVVVQVGSKLGQAEWIIKTISEGEVLLEHLSPSAAGSISLKPRHFILAFPAIQKSP